MLLYTFNKENDIEDIKDLIPSWNPLVNCRTCSSSN